MVTGADKLQARLDALQREGAKIAAASVRAGVNVLASAARDAVPGTIKEEIGSYVRIEGNRVRGAAGLMVFPRNGRLVRGLRPHGVYLEKGTRYIAARHMIARALRAAQSRASTASQRVGVTKLSQLKGR